MIAPARPRRGLTLIETMITVALLAVLATLAAPSFGSALARYRLKAAAEDLAHDLAEARIAATQRGAALHLNFQTGDAWCYAVATVGGCACAQAPACRLKTVAATDHPGVRLVEAHDATFLPGAGGVEGGAVLQGGDGSRLRVGLSRLGRPSVCAPGGAVSGYPAC